MGYNMGYPQYKAGLFMVVNQLIFQRKVTTEHHLIRVPDQRDTLKDFDQHKQCKKMLHPHSC